MVRNKLKSCRGASIIIALLVLLICVTAGTAALTAAGANLGRYTHMRADQQRYLAVSSAVKLVRSELCDQSFSASVQVEEDKSPILEEGQVPFRVEGLADDAQYTGVFEPWLLDDLKDLFLATAIPEDWRAQAGPELSIPAATACTYDGLGIQTDHSEELLGKVKWTLTLDDDYTLIARFWLEDDGAKYYPMVLTIPAVKTEETAEPQRIGAGQRWRTTKTVTVTWQTQDAVITQS